MGGASSGTGSPSGKGGASSQPIGNAATQPATSSGNALANTVNNTYNNALGGYNSNIGQGQALMGGGQGLLSDALGFGDRASNVLSKTGTIAGTNLKPYMNPYTKSVINASLNQMGREQQIQQRQLDDEAAAQGAFGGNRMYVQRALNDEAYDRNRGDLISNLNQQNFSQAQNAAQMDIGNRLNKAGALGNLSSQYGSMANNLTSQGMNLQGQGLSGLSSLANMGFGWGSDLENRQLAAGGMQQNLNQQIINAIKSQYGGFTNQPQTSLNILEGALPGIGGAGSTKTENNPGLLGTIGALTSIIGLF